MSDWYELQPIGAPINTAYTEQSAFLTKDELTLYFTSNRPDAEGDLVLDNNIWVSQRLTTDVPWGTPKILEMINSSGNDFGSKLSIDGHLLFFSSNRAGNNDIYISNRSNPNDDQGWSLPMRLGSEVNTPDEENAPMYLQSAEDGSGNLYFSRGQQLPGQLSDIYYVSITRNGEFRGPVVPVVELNSDKNDAAVSIRRDGREIFFWSQRFDPSRGEVLRPPDLWTSTRQSVHHSWSEPVKLNAPLNSDSLDATPFLSFDARTLLFDSARAPSAGGRDLWIATRTRGGGAHTGNPSQ